MAPLCTALWEQGRAFGTIGGTLAATGLEVEVTTFRSEAYVDHSRKPAVEWGDSLEVDLVAPGLHHQRPGPRRGRPGRGAPRASRPSSTTSTASPTCTSGVLRTPIDPERLFGDDPLRMLRAARFAARFALVIDPAIEAATAAMAGRLEKVSAERIRGELDLLMVARVPVGRARLHRAHRAGRALLSRAAGAAARAGPDPSPQGRAAPHVGRRRQDLARACVLRLAALFHDVGKPATRAISDEGVTFRFHEVVGAKMTRQRMAALKYSQDMIDDVTALVELHLRFHTYKLGWTDNAVRRYVRDAGDTARGAQRADPVRLHDAQRPQGGRAGARDGRARGAHRRARGPRGPGRDAPGPRRRTR